jgi:hypothetical protein
MVDASASPFVAVGIACALTTAPWGCGGAVHAAPPDGSSDHEGGDAAALADAAESGTGQVNDTAEGGATAPDDGGPGDVVVTASVVEGSIGDAALRVESAAFFPQLDDAVANLVGMGVTLSNQPAICDRFATSPWRGETRLEITIGASYQRTLPVSGTFPVMTSAAAVMSKPQSWIAVARFYYRDLNCNGSYEEAATGQVTVSQRSLQSIAGTFDLVFSDGEATGSFVAPACYGTGNGNGAPSCM